MGVTLMPPPPPEEGKLRVVSKLEFKFEFVAAMLKLGQTSPVWLIVTVSVPLILIVAVRVVLEVLDPKVNVKEGPVPVAGKVSWEIVELVTTAPHEHGEVLNVTVPLPLPEPKVKVVGDAVNEPQLGPVWLMVKVATPKPLLSRTVNVPLRGSPVLAATL